jgi:hypothetical protein
MNFNNNSNQIIVPPGFTLRTIIIDGDETSEDEDEDDELYMHKLASLGKQKVDGGSKSGEG